MPLIRNQEKRIDKVVRSADSFSMDKIGVKIGGLKSDIGNMLADISEKMGEEVEKYRNVKEAVEVKEKELHEIYEIQKSASSLKALLDLQKQKKEEYEAEMAEKKAALQEEITADRSEWEREKLLHEEIEKDLEEREKKKRKREKDEYE